MEIPQVMTIPMETDPMDMKYLAFCYADPAFYDIKRDTTNGSGARRFELPRDRDWTSWSLSTGEWLGICDATWDEHA